MTTALQAIIQDVIDGGFRELRGLRVSASVPVADTLINELIQGGLQALAAARPVSAPGAAAAAAATDPGAAAAGTPPVPGLPAGLRVDPADLVRFIRKAVVRAEAGRVVLDVDVAID